MACVFLFYSSSCHKKKHEESHIGNGSRTSCYLAPRPCREHWTWRCRLTASPCRERYPQMKEREHGVQHSNELPARATNTRHSTHKTPGCGTRTRITTHVKEQIHGIRRTHQDAALRRRCKNNIREGRRREDKKISRFILTSSRRGILLIVHGVLTPVSKLC